MKLGENDKLRGRLVEQGRRRVNEQVLVDAERSIRDIASRCDFGKRNVARLVSNVFANRNLVDEGGGDELANYLELQGEDCA